MTDLPLELLPDGWTIRFVPESKEGYCWEERKMIDVGVNILNPLSLYLHEIAHIGINPHGNKHTQEWFDEYLALMREYMPGVDIDESEKIIQRCWNLIGEI